MELRGADVLPSDDGRHSRFHYHVSLPREGQAHAHRSCASHSLLVTPSQMVFKVLTVWSHSLDQHRLHGLDYLCQHLPMHSYPLYVLKTTNGPGTWRRWQGHSSRKMHQQSSIHSVQLFFEHFHGSNYHPYSDRNGLEAPDAHED
jgi:hypothetical protein